MAVDGKLQICFYFRCLTSENLYFQETQRLMQEPVPGIEAIPDERNARYFHVVVAGPEGVRTHFHKN